MRSTSSGTAPRVSGTCSRSGSGNVSVFVDAVSRVAAGGTALDPDIVARMIGRRRDRGPLESLTPRDREVLSEMAEGKSNRGIAETLFISEAAVEKHVTAIFRKLGIDSVGDRASPRPGGGALPARVRSWVARGEIAPARPDARP